MLPLLAWARHHSLTCQQRLNSSLIGGCTFAEDPALSCAVVLPMWSAAVDPRVIKVRTGQIGPYGGHIFDPAAMLVRALRGIGQEHLLVDPNGGLTRLDIIDASVFAGPVSLHFDIPCDAHLADRIDAIRAFAAASFPPRQHLQLARGLQALHAHDFHAAGASLRETADLILGPGDWPGDGEHRKSLVRRLVAAGTALIRQGPRPILGAQRRASLSIPLAAAPS